MKISHTNVTEVLHVFGIFSSFVANKMMCVFVKFTTECLQVKLTWWQFTLKFTIEVHNECFVRDEVLTQSYIREKLLLITWYFFLTFAWAERRFMLWWQQTYKSWLGLEHICQWDDNAFEILKFLRKIYFCNKTLP